LARSRTIRLVLLAAGGLALLLPSVARAQNPAAAEALFEQARSAMAAGSYDIACARFRDSDKLDPAVGTRFNLADCEEKRGHIATAWSLFRGVLSELAQDDDRRPIAQQRVKALEPRLPYLTLTRTAQTPPGARLRVDGVELGEGSFGIALPMDPGAHDLSLLLVEGGQAQNSTVFLLEGEHKVLPVDATAAALLPAPDESQVAPATAPGETKRKWAYVAGGVGAFGVAFGAVTGVVTLSKKGTANANCDDSQHLCNQVGRDATSSGETYGTLSVVGFSVGIVGLATGAYLWFTAPKANSNAAHVSIPVVPELRVADGTGFLSVQGSF
jgi:hypothetical protein